MNLVSIITPAYNCSSTILDTYKSIAGQTYTEWEWLITDDCSSDESLNIIEGICNQDQRVKLFKNPINLGAAGSRNNSIKNARGHYIAFIDSDDIWVKEKLEYQIQLMEEKDIDFSFTSYEMIDQYGISLGRIIDKNNKNQFSYEDMLRKEATLGCSTVMLRSNAFSKIIMPSIKTTEDYALWLELLGEGHVAHKVDKVLMKYRVVPGSVSSNKFKTISNQWLVYREYRRLSLLQSLYYLFFYAKNAIFRK